jgi:hypothetical protein
MADVTYDALEEGEEFNAVSLNTRFSPVTNAINVISADALDAGALNSDHLPSMDISGGQTKSITINPGGGASCRYTEADAKYVASGTNGFVTLDSNGATGGTGSGGEVALAFAPTLDISSTGAGGVLVLSNTVVQQIGNLGFSGAGPIRVMAMFRLSVQDATGTWHPVHRTERFVQSGYNFNSIVGSGDQRPQMLDVPIRTLVVKSDLGGLDEVKGIRLRVCVYDPGGEVGSDQGVIQILHSHLSVVPLRSARP